MKLGGILSESVAMNGKFNVLVGIGLNIDNDEPTVCINDLLEASGSSEYVAREKFLGCFLSHYEKLMDTLFDEKGSGFDSIKEEYLSEWLHTDQHLTLENENNKKVIVKSISSSTGALIAVDEQQNKYELYPDGNRLDFFKGLITRRKFDFVAIHPQSRNFGEHSDYKLHPPRYTGISVRMFDSEKT